MKTKRFYFGLLLILSGLFLINAYGYSQDGKPDKKSRKEKQKAEMEANFRMTDSLLYFGQWVLEANFLQDKYGERISVPSTLNFIMVEGPKGVLQTGSNTGIGYNAVGGVTAEGRISDYKITRDTKNLRFTVTFILSTNLGTYDILLYVSVHNKATATISGTTSTKLTWDGQLVPLGESKVFKGQETL